MRSIVIKFGGTSLGDAERISRAARAVVAAQVGGAVAVVVSAMSGVTDRLVDIIDTASRDTGAARAQLDSLMDAHRLVAHQLDAAALRETPWTLDRLQQRCNEALKVLAQGDVTARDQILSTGEKLSAWLLLGVLRAQEVDAAIVPAEVLVRTTSCESGVEVDREVTYAAIRLRGDVFWRPVVRIMPGFTGADAQGRTTTLGRNASDYSAALLAAGLGWPLEIWTDVAGCYSADPRQVAGAVLLRKLSLIDAHRFARAGASVIHARTLEPLFDNPVPLSIVNSFAADSESTHIGGAETEALRGVAVRHDLLLARGVWPAGCEVVDSGRDVYADSAVALVQSASKAFEDALPVAVLSVFDDSLGVALLQRCRRALSNAGLAAFALWWSADENCVRIALPKADALEGLRVLHAALIAEAAVPSVNLALIGASGRVAGRLLELIGSQRNALAERGVDLHLVAVVNSRRALVSPEGIEAGDAAEKLANSPERTLDQWSHDLLALPDRPLVLIDCSASAEVAARYPQWLAAGIDLVTPNKHAPSASLEVAQAIDAARTASGANFLYETTVGAQLPLLRTLRELSAAGDQLKSLEAVLSGTLSYVLARVRDGVAFSAAVRDAVEIGYAEPHPAIDLSGADAARKLVILLRALGIEIALDQIELTPLVDCARLSEPDAQRLLDGLLDLDEHWRGLAEKAARNGECWIYRASYDNGVARLGPECVPLSHALARLQPCENALRLSSTYYRDAPLTIAGPGAGIDLTAAGVFADLMDVVQRRTHHRVSASALKAGTANWRIAA
jgi:aspartokinase/homoserine dehydrogenase 1